LERMLNRVKSSIREVLAVVFDTTSDSRIWKVWIEHWERVGGAFTLSESHRIDKGDGKGWGRNGGGIDGRG